MFGVWMQFDDWVKVKDGQCFVYGCGFVGDCYIEILLIELYGMVGEFVEGGQGLLLLLNGILEEIYFFGGVKLGLWFNLLVGGKVIYDVVGNIVKCVGSGVVIDVGS